MPSNTAEPQRVLRISPNERTARKVAVVNHDSLAGGLMADALARHLDLDAVVISPSELLGTLGRGEIALIIIRADLNSVADSGFDLTNSVYGDHPKTPIVILVDKLTEDSAIRAFRSGARGVFECGGSLSEFIHCVEHVRKGFIWAGKEGTDALIAALRKIPAPLGMTGDDLSVLTTRELQVVQYAARGKTNKAIASELYLSEHTVKNYIFRAFEKLHVSNRVELLFYLAARGHSFSPPEIERDEPAAEQASG